MMRDTHLLLPLLGCLALAPSTGGTTLGMNSEAARAVLEALQNSALSHEASLQIAGMQGNQGIIRKLKEFKIPATTQSFADALYASAHDAKAKDDIEQSFYFDSLKPKSQDLLSFLKQIETSPLTFREAIERRIALFTPPGSDIQLQAYIVAGGDGGGYTFGDTNFYLNIGFGGEFVVAKSSVTHELYHAVQGAFAGYRRDPVKGDEKDQNHQQKFCLNA